MDEDRASDVTICRASFSTNAVVSIGPKASISLVERWAERETASVSALPLGSSCYRSLSTVAPAAVVGSSRPANGLAAMRVRMSDVWRASSKRWV